MRPVLDATIHINAAAPIGHIDPHVYGQMFENAGNCVYARSDSEIVCVVLPAVEQ